MDEDSGITNPKVSGYLEKKCKMKMINSYKRYWFVLEGRLLLYYRSKDEYEAISPCKGSINLGPACNIKTCPSTSGLYVFQIQTRTSTITLRANNREDQNRWMQGIMSALNQNTNSKKLSHFRYSLDELTQNKSILRKMNSTPQQSDPSKQDGDKDKGIIQRLQRIGAHSYGGSLSAISQMETKFKNANSSSETLNSTSYRSSVLVDNNQYDSVNKNISSDSIEIRNSSSKENIYERISGDSSASANSREVTYSVPHEVDIRNSAASLKNNIELYEQQNTNNIESSRRPTTFLLENETYEGIPLNSPKKDSQNGTRQTSFILENHQYCSFDKIKSQSTDEVIYSEPKCVSDTDYNENNLSNKLKGEENAYSITKLYDSGRNSVNSTQYEDLDKCGDYSEPKYFPENVTTSKSKLKKCKAKKQSKTSIDENKKELKLKKSSSFIKRVWRKRRKHKEKEKDIDELYETVPDSHVEKIELSDDAAVQMLSELQNLLENKMPILLEQRSISHSEKSVNEDDSTSTNKNTNSDVDNGATVQMLAELQNILKDKRAVLCGLSSEIQTTESPTLELDQNKVTKDSSPSSSRSEKMGPLSPAKDQTSGTYPPYHDIPKNNPPVPLPPKKKRNTNNVSLDKILDDLEKEKNEDFSKRKVKTLIKQFSGSDSEGDVELRTSNRNNISREDIDSNELNRLLDELAKVTCAPILTPGATSSLISTNLTDEEIIKLLPTRRRRYSDPDYDIPRPHKSLTNLPRKENSPENKIGSTRFFGPILMSSDNSKDNHEKNLEESPQMLSMTPDSLEPISIQLEKCTHVPRLWDDNKMCYTSHNYIHLKHSSRQQREVTVSRNISTHFEGSKKHLDSMMIENDIYAQPKSLHSKLNKEQDDHKCNAEDLEDIFIDSLEIGQ